MNDHRLASGGYNDPVPGTFSQMRLHAKTRREARVSRARARDTVIHECVCRLIKGARNCEHASNVAWKLDDRDIGMSFFYVWKEIPSRERARILSFESLPCH